MSPRLEVELTSKRDDGTWTWRAAGARQPKGVVAAAVLYPDAVVGDVVKAEAEVDVDGITLTSVTPPPTKTPAESANRIELVGPPREFTPVISTLVPKHDRPRPERGARRDDDRRDRPSGDRGHGPEAIAPEVARPGPATVLRVPPAPRGRPGNEVGLIAHPRRAATAGRARIPSAPRLLPPSPGEATEPSECASQRRA